MDMAWIGLLGAKAVAGVGVGGMFTWLSQGLASMARMGGQVQVAQCIGRGERQKAHGFAQTAMQLALLMGLAYGIIVALFANPLVGFFRLEDAETLRAALDYTRIACGCIVFSFLSVTLTGIYTAQGDSKTPFVANLLQAMGYRTILSPHGGDSGIDITAYKDELPPRIVVQVKSQDGDIKETTIQSLKGAMREGDYGLFVTLSNYTKNAQKYLDSTPIIRGINGTELVDLVLKYYDQLSVKYRKMIPLKMVYIPVPPEE